MKKKHQPGCNSSPDCGCGGETTCILFDYSSAGSLDNFNITATDSTPLVDSGTYGSDVTMSSGVLTVGTVIMGTLTSNYAAYPKLDRTWCGFKASCYRPIPDNVDYQSPTTPSDWNDAALRAMRFIFEFNADFGDEAVIRFGERYELTSDSPVWPTQQIVQSGSATSGHWFIQFGDCGKIIPNVHGGWDGYINTVSTAAANALPPNATATNVQDGINRYAADITDYEFLTIPWYADATVLPFTAEITSGTAPNATYKLTFKGIVPSPTSGPIPAVTINNNTDSGSFAVSILEAGPEITPVSYYELHLGTTTTKLTYHGKNAHTGADSTPIDLEMAYPFQSPCFKGLSSGWHTIEIANCVSVHPVSGVSVYTLTILIDGQRVPMFRIPILSVTAGVDGSNVINAEPLPPFIYDFQDGMISGPSFRQGKFRSIKGKCPPNFGPYNGPDYNAPTQSELGEGAGTGGSTTAGTVAPNCQVAIESPGCQTSDNSPSPDYYEVTGMDFGGLVGALPSGIFYDTDFVTVGDLTTRDYFSGDTLTALASIPFYLKKEILCSFDYYGHGFPLTYIRNCVRGRVYLDISGSSPSYRYGLPVVASDLPSTPITPIDDTNFLEDGFVFSLGYFFLQAKLQRIYDFWRLDVLVVGNGLHYEIDNVHGYEHYSSRNDYVQLFGTWLSCPCDVGDAVTMYPYLLMDGVFSNINGPDGTDFINSPDSFDQHYLPTIARTQQNKGRWNVFAGSTHLGTGSLGNITLTPKSSLPKVCIAPKGIYHGCDSGTDYIVKDPAGNPPTITVKETGECAARTGDADESSVPTGTVASVTNGDCGKCQGCGCCEGKIATANYSITSSLNVYKKSSLRSGYLLCQSLPGLGGNQNSDGEDGAGTFSYCKSTLGISGFPVSTTIASDFCHSAITQYRIKWEMVNCNWTALVFFYDTFLRLSGNLFLTATPTEGACFSDGPFDITCTGGTMLGGYILANTTDGDGNPYFDPSLVIGTVDFDPA